MSQGFELSIEADLDNLRAVRNFVNESGQALGVDADTLGDLCLVVDEAVTNVIVHGYEGQDGVVEVDFRGEGDAVLIHIRDRARSFDPGEVEPPKLKSSLAQRKFGGMGVYLIRKLTDEADFRPLPGGGNELRLVKRGAITG